MATADPNRSLINVARNAYRPAFDQGALPGAACLLHGVGNSSLL